MHSFADMRRAPQHPAAAMEVEQSRERTLAVRHVDFGREIETVPVAEDDALVKCRQVGQQEEGSQ
jgi:hypothetical protein